MLISVWINCVTASQGFSLVKFSQMNWSASLNPIPMAQCGRMNSSLANFPRICQSLIWRWKVSSAKVVQFLYKVNLVTQSRTVDAGKLRSQPNLHSTRPQVSSMPLSAPLSNFQHFPWRHELLIFSELIVGRNEVFSWPESCIDQICEAVSQSFAWGTFVSLPAFIARSKYAEDCRR